MLIANIKLSYSQRIPVVLLFIISLSAFQIPAKADLKANTAEEYHALGYEEQQKGNYNEAIKYYSKALSLGFEDATIYNDLAIIYEQLGILSRAEECYKRSIALDDKYLPAYTNLAYFYLNQGNKQKAVEYFQLRYDLGDPADPWTQKAKEAILASSPDAKRIFMYREADALNRELVQKTRQEFYDHMIQANEHYKVGQTYLEDEKYDEALKEFDKALALTPKVAKYLVARDQANLQLSKQRIQQQSHQAVSMINSGDYESANKEIQKILTTIQSKPNLRLSN